MEILKVENLCKTYGKKTKVIDFKNVQNKLHYAVTGNTAAEIIYNRVIIIKKLLIIV